MSNSDCEEIVTQELPVLTRPPLRRRRRREPSIDEVIIVSSQASQNNNNTQTNEIVDLTCPTSDDIIDTVDLTSPTPRKNKRLKNKNELSSTSQRQHRTVQFTCPVCLEPLNKIIGNGHEICSTVCGHVFCKPCITKSIQSSKKCPTCRKKLTPRNVHPLYL